MSRAIRPDDFEVITQIPGIAAVARDEELRLFWCSPSCKWVPGEGGAEVVLMGTVVEDVISDDAANERNVVHRRVMETGRAESHFRLSLGARVLCTVFPLDEGLFGHKGIFAVSVDAPTNTRLIAEGKVPILSTPNLHVLSPLSARELEVLYFVALGMSTMEIAQKICRANKTIEHHVNSIHGKLGTHSRGQLVRFASERGIQSFSEEEWASIVEGSRRIRKRTKRKGSEIEGKGVQGAGSRTIS